MTTPSPPDRMRCIALDGTGAPDVLVPGVRPVPQPGPGDLLIRVRACGVCGHDLLARRGRLSAGRGTVLGHEIAGEVVGVGVEVTDDLLHRRVALVQRIPCGHCPECAAGLTTLCREGPGFYGDDIPGGYSEYVLATPANVVPVPDSVPDVAAAILSCAVGTGLRALRRAGTRAGDLVVVTGAGGGVGVHAVQLAHHFGATVVALTGSPAKEKALLDLGADAVLVSPDVRAVRDCVRDLGGRRGADVAIELTGGPTFPLALRALGPRGQLVLVGNTEPATLPLEPGLSILKELTIHGSAHADTTDLAAAVELVASGAVTPVAAQTWPLDEAARAHEAVERRKVTGRAVLVP
ncbi:alcohol dehydrogenase catalytic domain-containing protein [Amycolatopsis acidiphila]|nr:zinc-binding dehydrogenase [Amycolatopsis acidiphila]UIJ63302.1 alcohol dehydrogenase catalytic domain-containing protein [Amycolatopsis acidiphila]GHG74895.1 alcohol dehydrogenase [Amycolatopsis acidiphila]